MTVSTTGTSDTYDRIVHMVFSTMAPGTKLVERQLASELGVSRVPVRETLAKLVAQGVLVGGEKGQGVRVRDYSHEEVRQLYQFRETIEGGVAHAAARAATGDDLLKLDLICEQMEAEVGHYGSARWADLDHRFHETLAQASRNERFARAMKSLLAECHYVFYLHPSHRGRPRPSAEDAERLMRNVVKDHRALLDLIRAGDADAAEQKARGDMRKSAERASRALMAGDLSV